MREYEKEILVLSIGEAKRRCESLFSDTRIFKCVESTTGGDANIDWLAPYLRELFSRYETIEAIYGDARLGRREIAPSELDSRFIRIGTGIEHTQLVVKPGEEIVYVIDGSETTDDELKENSYPSIYHWLLIEGRVPPI
jgi:hypothetical protein